MITGIADVMLSFVLPNVMEEPNQSLFPISASLPLPAPSCSGPVALGTIFQGAPLALGMPTWASEVNDLA